MRLRRDAGLKRQGPLAWVIESVIAIAFLVAFLSDPSSRTLQIGGGMMLFFYVAWIASKLYLRTEKGQAAVAEYEARRANRS